MQGFLTTDFAPLYEQAIMDLIKWIREGHCDIAKTYSKASKARLAQLQSSTAAQTAASSSSGFKLIQLCQFADGDF